MGRKAWLCAWACCVATALLGVATVNAHQTGSNKGVSVTLHVAPDDAPVAGRPATIIVTKVNARRGTFSWRKCGCHLNVKDASGRVVLNRNAGRRTSFTFPRSGAYQITFSGSVKRNGRSVRFRVPFAIRAD
jgi:hypothetical protein